MKEIIRGGKTTEFYMALVMILVWGSKHLGFEYHPSPEDINQVAEAIKQAHEGSFDPASLAGIAYILARYFLKSKAIGGKSSD